MVIRYNPFEDVVVNDNFIRWNNETYLTGRIAGELKPPKNVSDTQMIENIMEKGIDYKKIRKLCRLFCITTTIY